MGERSLGCLMDCWVTRVRILGFFLSRSVGNMYFLKTIFIFTIAE